MSHGTTQTAQRLRTIVIGGGMIGTIHQRAACLAGADVVGVVEVDMERARSTAQRWGVPHYYDNLDEAMAAGADVVHVCTPNATHAGFAHAALEAGMHVICEKPLCVDAKQAASLADLAEQKGLVAAVPYIYRYHPLVREIRSQLLAGDLGKLYLIHGSYLQDWLLSPLASSWRVDPVLGGPSRAFADIGSHWCDLVEWVCDDPIASLIADTSIAIPERPVNSGATFSGASADHAEMAQVKTEDIVTMLFRTVGGVPGTLTVSQVSAGRKNHLWFELDAAMSSAVFDQENPDTIWVGGDTSSRILYRDPNVGSVEERRLATTPAGHVQGWSACFEAFVADVYATVRGNSPEGIPTFRDGARSLQLVEALLESAKTRQWKELSQ